MGFTTVRRGVNAMIRTGEALAIAGRSAACIARRAGASQDGAAERCNSGARAFGLPNSQVAARYVDGMGELVTAETGEASATAERVAACTGRGASASQDGAAERCNSGARAFGLPSFQVAAHETHIPPPSSVPPRPYTAISPAR